MWQLSKLILLLIVSFVAAQDYDESNNEVAESDGCESVKCGTGEMCSKGKCVCLNECSDGWLSYDRQLCVDETTYQHECDLWRNQCYCRNNDDRCGQGIFDGHRPTGQTVIRYFAQCSNLNDLCNWKHEEATFSQRLGLWFRDLFNSKWSVSSDVEEDDSLLRPMLSKARNAANKVFSANSEDGRVNGGVISFWFCEIDRDNSGSLSGPELSRLTQLLLPSEPCLNVFLGTCSSSGTISTDQWHQCFGINSSERMDCSNFQ